MTHSSISGERLIEAPVNLIDIYPYNDNKDLNIIYLTDCDAS